MVDNVAASSNKKQKICVTLFLGLIVFTLISCAVFEDPSRVDIEQEKRLKQEGTDALQKSNARTFAEGIEALKAVVAADPKNYPEYKQLAVFYMQLDPGLEPIGPIPGSPAGSKFIRFGRAYRPETLSKALAAVQAALKIKPDYAEAYAVLGDISIQQEKFEDAQQALTKAEALGSKNPNLPFYWADLDFRKGDINGAFEQTRKALRDGPTDPAIINQADDNFILGYKALNDFKNVDVYYQKKFASNPKNWSDRFVYARYLLEIESDYDNAIKYEREVVALAPYPLHEQILATCLYAKWADLLANQKETEAQKYFDEAQSIDTNLDIIMAEEAYRPDLVNLVKALESKGVSINARDYDGSTALIIASNAGRIDGAKFLLDLGADPNIETTGGWTALFGAVDNHQVEITKLLLDHKADKNHLYKGVPLRNYAEIKGYYDLLLVIGDP